MTIIEITVIFVGLFIGYWVVSMLTSKKQPIRRPSETHHDVPEDEPKPVGKDSDISWHQVLNVTSVASVDEIRKAYRTQMSQYHPDKVATLGVELRALAEKKSKDITNAYRVAMHSHGLDP